VILIYSLLECGSPAAAFTVTNTSYPVNERPQTSILKVYDWPALWPGSPPLADPASSHTPPGIVLFEKCRFHPDTESSPETPRPQPSQPTRQGNGPELSGIPPRPIPPKLPEQRMPVPARISPHSRASTASTPARFPESIAAKPGSPSGTTPALPVVCFALPEAPPSLSQTPAAPPNDRLPGSLQSPRNICLSQNWLVAVALARPWLSSRSAG